MKTSALRGVFGLVALAGAMCAGGDYEIMGESTDQRSVVPYEYNRRGPGYAPCSGALLARRLDKGRYKAAIVAHDRQAYVGFVVVLDVDPDGRWFSIDDPRKYRMLAHKVDPGSCEVRFTISRADQGCRCGVIQLSHERGTVVDAAAFRWQEGTEEDEAESWLRRKKADLW